MSLYGEGPNLDEDQVTQMPVCTRLYVDDLTLLATLKLPQVCELSASFYHPEFNMIWETHIAVNANLSGLELLHVYGWHQQVDLIGAGPSILTSSEKPDSCKWFISRCRLL